jgi:hypothetical protein
MAEMAVSAAVVVVELTRRAETAALEEAVETASSTGAEEGRLAAAPADTQTE